MPSTDRCARAILDTVPAIVQAIRVEMRLERMHDLSVPQFRTLAYIGRQPGCSLTDVAEFIGLTAPTMSVLINGLVERGLVHRAASLLDRRRVVLNLTDAGAQMHTHALDGTLAWLSGLLAPLVEEERLLVIQAMDLLCPIFSAETTRSAVESEPA
ncbi:MAG: MarR family transcriptional regulator [Caldilinea sp.]|nr:MarR family transcriptional regulator [Caldilinea sp.]MCB0068716.1 MarR family transcriptional regulator [Caldilineaceae bacterium]MCB0146131.1 MarR family transcriptional regulator [Caldilineaceae bacterium]MCB9122658.1 MarR family transcriptional regulator [Caldilineaceae bacterium]MCO5210706.1 MarR family transcriptional regulator [Caldilinea sp.]